MARQNFDSKVRTIIASLEVEMKAADLLGEEFSLRYQVGSPTYGNSYWVGITGGPLETGVSTIETLHLPSDCGRDNWLAAVLAFRHAIHLVRAQRKISELLGENQPLGPHEI